MLTLQFGDRIELSYEDAPATKIRATVGRLLTDRDEGMGSEVEDYAACWIEITGICSYYDIGDARLGAWSYRNAYSEVGRISDLVSFEPDIVSVELDGTQLRLEPGQTVIPHGPDRDLDVPATIGVQP